MGRNRSNNTSKVVDKKPSVKSKGGLLISRVDYPITVKYGDESVRVSPRAQLVIADTGKLESKLPDGIFVKKA